MKCKLKPSNTLWEAEQKQPNGKRPSSTPSASRGNDSPNCKNVLMKHGTAPFLKTSYLPYKPKRRTCGSSPPERTGTTGDITDAATGTTLRNVRKHTSKEKWKMPKTHLRARDILPELGQLAWTNRHATPACFAFSRQAVITAKVVKGKETEADKYRDYFEFSKPLKKCTSHQLLAIRRAEAEGAAKVSISPDDEGMCRASGTPLLSVATTLAENKWQRAVQEPTNACWSQSIETEFPH